MLLEKRGQLFGPLISHEAVIDYDSRFFFEGLKVGRYLKE